MDRDVIITYETLFELLRREKIKPELQKLDKTFFEDIVRYLEEKQKILESQRSKNSVFASSEVQKTQKQIDNVKRMLKELYERRESKVIQIALVTSRSEEVGDFPEMLDEEKKFYQELMLILDKHRQSVLYNVLQAKLPKFKSPDKPKELKTENEPSTRLVRVLHTIPKFVGDNLNIYGPYEEEDIISLPEKVANILIKNNRVELIQAK